MAERNLASDYRRPFCLARLLEHLRGLPQLLFFEEQLSGLVEVAHAGRELGRLLGQAGALVDAGRLLQLIALFVQLSCDHGDLGLPVGRGRDEAAASERASG